MRKCADLLIRCVTTCNCNTNEAAEIDVVQNSSVPRNALLVGERGKGRRGGGGGEEGRRGVSFIRKDTANSYSPLVAGRLSTSCFDVVGLG